MGEHIDSGNMKSISEILEAPLILAAMVGNCDQIIGTITETLIKTFQCVSQNQPSDSFESLNQDDLESQVQSICWMMHSLRILYKQITCRLEVEGVTMLLPIVE